MYYQGLINKYREFLPVTDATPVVTLTKVTHRLLKLIIWLKKSE